MTVRSRARALPPFDRLVERHGRALLRFCRLQVGVERAEDCVQETLLAALRSYDELRDGDAARAWLFAIASRKIVDAHRARAHAPEPVDDVEARGLAIDRADGDPTLWRRVARLPEKQRQAVTLRYAGDLSHREIAAVMRTSESAARRNVFEALQQLRAALLPSVSRIRSLHRRKKV